MKEQQAREEAIEIIDDVLFTDYHDVITRKERGNLYQLGMATTDLIKIKVVLPVGKKQ